MRPILTVEFSAKNGDIEFKEESVPIHSPDELFDFVAPGGGCERIPDEVDEIQMVFLPPEHPNTKNAIAPRWNLAWCFLPGLCRKSRKPRNN